MPLNPYACTNCGTWQRYFAVPPNCPVCCDVRNDLPEDGWEFVTPAQLAPKLHHHWREAIPGVWEFWSTPRFGLDGHGWLIIHPEGNVAFEAAPHYSPAQLAKIAELGGIHSLAASHPHGYGALYQLQDHFQPRLLIQKEDLEWTKAMRVTLPYDEEFEIHPGLTLYHTGGHYDGHAVLYDRQRKALFAGDSLKIDFNPDGSAQGISCHKAFHKQIPLTRDEARRYRQVYETLDFTTVFTPFDFATNTSTKAALALFDGLIAGSPSTAPIAIQR
jgi:hypothetical protein